MNLKFLFVVLTLVFLILSLLSMINFTSLEKAKWFDNGIDMVVGIILIYLGSVLYSTYKQTRNRNISYSAAGVFVMAFQKVVEIFLQEWQISIGYQYPPSFLGANLGVIGWGISDSITVIGILLIYVGFKEVAK